MFAGLEIGQSNYAQSNGNSHANMGGSSGFGMDFMGMDQQQQ